MDDRRYFRLQASELGSLLTQQDNEVLAQVAQLYQQMNAYQNQAQPLHAASDTVAQLYDRIGKIMQGLVATEPRIRIYPFTTDASQQAEVSRLISKLRDIATASNEFVYYMQRAYEILFKYVFIQQGSSSRQYRVVPTPLTQPQQHYGVHRIPLLDDQLHQTVIGVLLRGALLPSMIMGKEIEEYSSIGYQSPFALFRIKRDEQPQQPLSYVLDLKQSYFNPEQIDGSTLIIADPMNALGGTLITIIKFLESIGVKPRKIITMNVISSLQGCLQLVRAIDNLDCNSLWLDPTLNQHAYILPGLGDAGDRLNGVDGGNFRNILQLIAGYDRNLNSLYTSQIAAIEHTLLD